MVRLMNLHKYLIAYRVFGERERRTVEVAVPAPLDEDDAPAIVALVADVDRGRVHIASMVEMQPE